MNRPLKVLLFGEVLFDVFPDGARLGGAPLNLAIHLHRLGAEAMLLSAVGEDELGDRALREIVRQGVDTTRIVRVPRPTGSVKVTLDEAKIPSYCFLSDCAYDFIPRPEMDFSGFDLFCFGTLAQRGASSRSTLRKIFPGISCKIFCDVNLRQNFYSKEILEESLRISHLAKLNDEELEVISRLFGIAPQLDAVAERFQLETVILTLGPQGCEVWNEGRSVFSPACPAEVVSTVGAGDAFSAGFLYHYLSGSGIEIAAQAGNQLAAKVASLPGTF